MLKTVGFPSTRTGDQTIVAGNLVIGTAGKGIDFSADPSASGMTSELFDDYEEGTWTPTYVPETNAFTSIEYNAATGGYYTKVGRLVTCHFRISTNALDVGTATGAVYIGGLPFTSVNYTGFQAPSGSIGLTSNFGGDYPSTIWQLPNSTQAVMMYRTAANGATSALTVADLSTAVSGQNDMFATLIYLAA
jgi:hypothetical protein